MKNSWPLPRLVRGLWLALIVVTLQACSVDLYTNLDEREANEMVATLLSKGIAAGRVVQKDGKLTVTVDENEFSEAVTALNMAGLPKQKFATLGSVFQQEGLVASPVQERAQMIYALSEELSRTVSEIDGVLSARVHVVLPDNDPLQRNAIPASASVFIRHEAGLDVNPLIPRIKTLVANSISGLTYEKVSVVPVASQRAREPVAGGAELTSFLGLWMLPASVAKARLIFGCLLGCLIAAVGCLGYLAWRRQSRRRKVYQLQPYGPAK
ncbi:type III secretion component, RhcJ protein (plasmid) [Sinorhizobium fredii NGR234]|uniref:Lipoprotein n=1 Tax=Sinorhizobium fredii (strain NBRC 101917 / NGR234) TaxID=394 RepID=C3KNA7_SINFN|nr:type III secretion inner membrane ring lipoprotein SctJ [Sinorhizobium fredii]ACP23737.1 type III secretion component, RhcJ protein [Sinorhizobium fredii NGR234]